MKTFLDWSAYENAGLGDAYADIPKHGGNFAKAVAVCINSRHCEHKDKGVMCPSYRISDNPLFSTGGRVRLLKAALNSDVPDNELTGAQLAETMDLCVSCKGCKRECENEVDMAMIKIEYLAQRYSQSGVPVRTRLFASLPQLLHKYPWLKTLIAWRNKSSLLAKAAQAFLGISSRRTLPLPVNHKAVAACKNTDQPEQTVPISSTEKRAEKTVVLFMDTFTQNFEPHNADAALAVLQAGGYTVVIARDESAEEGPLCCGRTSLAHGLVDKAKQQAARVLKTLQPYAQAGLPIIGLEPACLLAIRDDYRFLGLGETADKVASNAVLFEEFIAKEHSAKRMQLDFKRLSHRSEPTLVHGHCHQKAVGAMKSMRKVLKLIPDFKFELIESACCGMAGSFGLEAEHMEDSLAMAEQSLLPSIRNQPGAHIIANGFSCRHQISENTGRQPAHIAVLLHESITAT